MSDVLKLAVSRVASCERGHTMYFPTADATEGTCGNEMCILARALLKERERGERWRKVATAYKLDMHGEGYTPTESGWDESLRLYNAALAAESPPAEVEP